MKKKDTHTHTREPGEKSTHRGPNAKRHLKSNRQTLSFDPDSEFVAIFETESRTQKRKTTPEGAKYTKKKVHLAFTNAMAKRAQSV